MDGGDENVDPGRTAAMNGLAFATQLPCGGGGGGCVSGGDGHASPARSPPSAAAAAPALAFSQDGELLTTQPEVEVIDSRMVGHGRRAQVSERETESFVCSF